MRSVQTRPDAIGFRKALEGKRCYAPRLIVSEIANALWKTIRFQNLDVDEAEKLFSKMMTVPELISDEDHIVEALKIAATAEHPVYDCLFIAMGRSLNAPILTADKKLRRKFPDDKFAAIET